MKHIQKCPKCHSYTIKETCPKCKTKTISTKPAKFSPQDKYGEYRRKEKKQTLKEKKLY